MADGNRNLEDVCWRNPHFFHTLPDLKRVTDLNEFGTKMYQWEVAGHQILVPFLLLTMCIRLFIGLNDEKQLNFV